MPIGQGARVPVRDGGAYPNNGLIPPQRTTSVRNSGYDAVGLGFLSGDIDDDDDDDDSYDGDHKAPAIPPPAHPQPTPHNAGILRKPSIGLPMNPAAGRQPVPVRSNYNQQQPLQGQPILRPAPANQSRPPPYASTNVRVPISHTAQPVPRPPRPAFIPIPQPVTSPRDNRIDPHPLGAPVHAIVPVFARPSQAPLQREVKFSPDAIMRGNSEETLLSKSTLKGADFWRRFSVIVKDEDFASRPSGQRSSWLSKNQARSSRMNVCVWAIGISLLVAIGGVIALVWFFTHNSPASGPKALGGSANEADSFTTSSTRTSSTSTSSPLRTVTGNLPPSVTPSATIPRTQQDIATGFVKRFDAAVTPSLPVNTAMPNRPLKNHHRQTRKRLTFP